MLFALDSIDSIIGWILGPLSAYILLSGLDDLFVLLAAAWVWIGHWRLEIPLPTEADLVAAVPKRIAIFVPLWKEFEVIGKMLEHNIAANKYTTYDFFVGTYPNDGATIEAVQEIAARFPRVHLAVCPHDGPTSKADCLNWVFQRMLLHEERHGCHFDMVVTHDAEDLIHPEALRWINYFGDHYDFIQIPVLALPTPFLSITHGIYCDEFAEFQTRDLPVRRRLGGFVPSAGVGTGYSREALEKLAVSGSNRIFEPVCLTEDYENGLRLKNLGCKQIFVPITKARGSFVATREFFPQNRRAAIRQRTRWVTGISLQSWDRHGWSGGIGQVYWLWRDRKSLIGNPLSLLANAIFLYGMLTLAWATFTGGPWGLAHFAPNRLLPFAIALQMIHTLARGGCVTRVYGWRFALGVPIRAVFANWINAIATTRALYRFAIAKFRRQPLVWLKTEHAYPSRTALLEHKRFLTEMLICCGYITEEELLEALATKVGDGSIEQYLVATGKITDDQLCEALALQQGLPIARIEPKQISRNVARSLPKHIVSGWKVVPFKVASGSMFIAGTEAPGDDLTAALRPFTRLEIRFHLMTPKKFTALQEQLL